MDCNKSSSSSSGTSVTPNNKKDRKKRVVKQTKGGAVKLSTDPQSIAARERRHRISDRFRTLQSMVPGGTKMDTVSMLEKAIQYVKFLKTQIWLHQTVMSSSTSSLEDSSDHDPSIFYHSTGFPAMVQSQVPATFPPYINGFQGDDHQNIFPRNNY